MEPLHCEHHFHHPAETDAKPWLPGSTTPKRELLPKRRRKSSTRVVTFAHIHTRKHSSSDATRKDVSGVNTQRRITRLKKVMKAFMRIIGRVLRWYCLFSVENVEKSIDPLCFCPWNSSGSIDQVPFFFQQGVYSLVSGSRRCRGYKCSLKYTFSLLYPVTSKLR